MMMINNISLTVHIPVWEAGEYTELEYWQLVVANNLQNSND